MVIVSIIIIIVAIISFAYQAAQTGPCPCWHAYPRMHASGVIRTCLEQTLDINIHTILDH